MVIGEKKMKRVCKKLFTLRKSFPRIINLSLIASRYIYLIYSSRSRLFFISIENKDKPSLNYASIILKDLSFK